MYGSCRGGYEVADETTGGREGGREGRHTDARGSQPPLADASAETWATQERTSQDRAVASLAAEDAREGRELGEEGCMRAGAEPGTEERIMVIPSWVQNGTNTTAEEVSRDVPVA
jgi:hypothetical protein